VQAWLLAARPRTLPVSVGPVLVGLAVAHVELRTGPSSSAAALQWLPALAALAGALLLQIGSNLANDLFDFEKGADGADRIGPPRASQLGLLSPSQMRGGMIVVFAAAAGVGLYLIAVGGWPIAAVGIASIAAALAYTGGPWPFGYRGLGDVAVFLFFGVVAVVGTAYLQTGVVSGAALMASLPVGSLATAILVVNNTRDIESDRAAGKRTLAVRLGRRGARIEYGVLVFAPFAALPAWAFAGGASLLVLAPLVLLPRAVGLCRVVATRIDGPALNEALAGTARLGFLFCVLFAAGLLGGWLSA
jgi:1,4-dihydroxy-2-naphthoate octaprenyltransferase